MSELSAIYTQDFYKWARRNAELLRQGRLQEIDVEHLAEELESMGRRERHELVSRLKILLGHLLKWEFQPAYRSSSWRSSIVEQRLQVRDLLAFSPSLKPFIGEAVKAAYPDAVNLAVKETGLIKSVFPESCTYDFAQILDDDFFPEQSDR